MDKNYDRLISNKKELISKLIIDAVSLIIVGFVFGLFSKTSRYIMFGIAAICFLIAIIFEVQIINLKKEKEIAEEQQRQEAERLLEQQRIEKQKAEERRKHEQEERERKRKEHIQKKIDEFNSSLLSIPIVEIELSDSKINNQIVLEMPEIKFAKPRKNSSFYSFTDFVVIDVETTGLKIQSEIIEISAIKYIDFAPIEAFTTLIKPEKPIPEEVSDINNITNEMVADAPTIKQVIPALEQFIGKSTIIGHNLMFDLRFLYKYGCDFTAQKRKYIDTLELAKSKLKRFDQWKFNASIEKDTIYEWDVEDYKLDSLCYYYDIHRDDAHRALSDCYATAQVFESILKNEYELDFDKP